MQASPLSYTSLASKFCIEIHRTSSGRLQQPRSGGSLCDPHTLMVATSSAVLHFGATYRRHRCRSAGVQVVSFDRPLRGYCALATEGFLWWLHRPPAQSTRGQGMQTCKWVAMKYARYRMGFSIGRGVNNSHSDLETN